MRKPTPLPYDKPVLDSLKAIDTGVGRLNTALMLGLASLHPIAGYAFGATTGLGLTAIGGMTVAEAHKQNDSSALKKGLFNVAIGLTAAAAPFIPEFPLAARLAPLGLVGLREIWLRLHEKNRSTFTLPTEVGNDSAQVSSKASPSSRVAEVSPFTKDGRMGLALNSLAELGWSFQSVRGEEGELKSLDARQAHQYLSGERDQTLRTGERILLLEPGHQSFQGTQNWHHVVDVEGVAAVDFFHGSGDPSVLTNPELGKALKVLEQMGVETTGAHPRYRFHRGAAATYLGYQRGHEVSMSLGGLSLAEGTVPLDTVTALDKLTRMTAEEREKFMESRLLGADATTSLKSVESDQIEVELEENFLTIGGFAVEVRD